VSKLREEQITEANPFISVDANLQGTNNIYEQGIFESVLSKKNQLELATQVV
jgi:T-complex protein 1 subunit epsilon